MRINSINTTYVNHAINKNVQQKSFKGLWGDSKQTGIRDYSFGFSIKEERDYHPFADESEEEIKNNLIPGSELIDSAQGVDVEYVPIRAMTLPILTAEYELYMKSPNSLSYAKRDFISKIEKVLHSGKGKDYIDRTIREMSKHKV